MAIALDVASNSGLHSVSPYTWNHTVTGSQTLLIVGLEVFNNGLQPTTSSVTYNGVLMNRVVVQQNSNSTRFSEVSLWFLFAPTTGTNVVSVTCTNISSSIAGAVSYTGAQQSNVADATNKTFGTTNGTKTVTVTTVADNCWTIATAGNFSSSGSPITTPGNTVRWQPQTSGTGEDTNGPLTPAGNQNMIFTLDSTISVSHWEIVAASFAPFSLPTTNGASLLQLML